MTQPISPAGFGPRSAATAIDYAVIAAVSAGLGAILGKLSGLSAGDEMAWASGLAGDAYAGALAGVIAGFTIVGALYMAVEAWTGATIGKRIVGLVVAGEDGRPASLSLLTARYLAKNCHLLLGAAANVSGFWFVGALVPVATMIVVAGSMMILTDERRALHDVVAKTIVIGRPARRLSP